MEKRIRIVWILSLVSVLFLILVQGYWLYNQYTYVLDAYTEELGEQILQAAGQEYELRKVDVKSDYTFVVNTNSEYTKSDSEGIHENNKMGISMVRKNLSAVQDSMGIAQLTIDSLRRYAKEIANLPSDSLYNYPNALASDSINSADSLKLFFSKGFSLNELHENINRAIINYHISFQEEQLDSVLHASLPELNYSITALSKNDTITASRWERAGSIFDSRIQVYYVYSPFQQEGVCISVKLPTQPLFENMAFQLLLAFGILLLLIVCLVFQIKTILKQKKIGELRQNFVNTMIHELKRPVQTLKTFIAFLGDKEMRSDDCATEEVVQDAMFELDNLSGYLNKLKDMVRADNESTPLNLSRLNLHELTDKVIRLTHIPVNKKVTFTTDFDMESPFIEADSIHLANVLSNLIENAIKYSNASVEIEIKAMRKGNMLRITVSDNGIGIPLIEQDKVFAKFYRGNNLPDRNIPGLGLGLSYVKLIGEAHHGNVSLESIIGQGTSITLCIPQ